MVTRPAVHRPSATVAELRAFFHDDHVHMALLVERGKVVGTVERADLAPAISGETPAIAIATLDGRTIRPDAVLSEAFDAMKRNGRRRVAVTTGDATFLGLLCLKTSGLGFCSDTDVTRRRCARLSAKQVPGL